jgi:chromosomal replication initiation ATPase DnaA
MISKWDIQPLPAPKNKDRHKLLVKGDMKDIFFIVKKLGKICSRPEKTKGDFNFTLYLSKMDIEIMTKLKQVTSELSSLEKKDASTQDSAETKQKSVVAEQAMVDKSVAKEEEAKVAKAKEEQVQSEKAKEEEAKATKAKEEQAQAEKVKEEEAKVAKAKEEQVQSEKAKEEEAKATKAKEEQAQAEKVKEEEAKAAKAKEEQAEADKAKEEDVAPSTSMRGMSIPSRKNKQEVGKSGGKIPAKEEVKVVNAKETSGRRQKKLLQTKWSMELPMIPVYNFEKFVAGSHNRFAHAAAMAVIDNPGTMYNPLLIFGIPGTGKTHFIHSIAYGLASSLGHQNIFVTDGIKLSRGLDLAIKDGQTARLEEMFSQAKALVIDDVHLLMLGEGNKKFLSKLLNDFMEQDKQIVVTSLFPPKALGGLEDQLGFQLSQGWMVDLKIPNTEKYKAIVTKMMDGANVKLDDTNVDKFFISNMMALGDVVETLEQCKKLEKLITSSDNQISHEELLQMLIGEAAGEENSLLEDDRDKAAAFNIETKDNWFKWGIFYPKGCEKEAKWIIYSLYQKSKELDINVEWDQIFIEEYNSDESYGVPFKISDFASEKKVNGVIIMGPQSTSVLGAQEQEFRHLSKKILTSFFVKSSWISANQIKGSAPYVKILMDLI